MHGIYRPDVSSENQRICDIVVQILSIHEVYIIISNVRRLKFSKRAGIVPDERTQTKMETIIAM